MKFKPILKAQLHLQTVIMASLFLGFHLSYAEIPPNPIELLNASDRARGAAAAAEGLSWTADIQTVFTSTTEPEITQVRYLIKARDNDALAEAISPAKNRGEMMLFNDRNLWFFKVGLRKPVAISARQKLLGQAANGDIASIHYARDYEGKVIGSESIQGVPTWKLELKAKTKNVTYDRIRYWISKKRKLGIKAEYLTLDGEIFKKAEFQYKNVITIDHHSLPFISQAVISDNQTVGEKTTLRYSTPRIEQHSVGTFNVNNLIR